MSRFLTVGLLVFTLTVGVAYPAQRKPEAVVAVAAVEPQIGLIRTLIAVGKFDQAALLIKPLRLKYPTHIEVLEAAAELAAARQDHFDELAAYQIIDAQQPGYRLAVRGKVLALARLGMPQLALELADRYPDVLTIAEHEAIAADRTARLIRWGVITADSGRGPTRFAGIDRALVDSEAAAALALNPIAELSGTERQLALDRIIALHARYRMRDAVILYEAMAARPAALPAYVQSAAAGAYLYLEQPERARDLYRAALADVPDNLESRLGLFYALAEGEEHAAALTQIENTVAVIPSQIDAWSPKTIHENPAYARVLAARAIAPLLANRPGEGWQRLQALSARAPGNMDIRTDYASAMRARGWPRTAEEELRWILALVPGHSGALGERAGALLEMRDFKRAEAALAAAQAEEAENGRVVRAGRLVEVNNLRELIVDGTYGRSSGGPGGTRDHALDTWLYSSPIAYNYRVFGHVHNAAASFAAATAKRNRAGVGLEYRSPLITASGELSHDATDGNTGLAAALAYTPDDYWTFGGTLATESNDAPLQASLAGISARRFAGEIGWRASESRSAAVSYALMDFSDGNRRDIAQGHWTERVIAGPVYKLEVTGSVYASQNSRTNAAYFNPERDASATLEFSNEWLQWRRYTQAFRHRVIVEVGSYWQQDFGSGAVVGGRYEQEWEADDRLTLRYGLGRTRQPYDGVQEVRNHGFFYLNWRF